MRDFFKSKKFNKIDSLCTAEVECWASEDNFRLIRIPIYEDPMSFSNVVAVMEMQLRGRVADIPFYAKEIAQRFSPEGHG